MYRQSIFAALGEVYCVLGKVNEGERVSTQCVFEGGENRQRAISRDSR